MRRVFLNDRSERDLVEIARYITRESGNRQVARAFIRRVREKCENLASFPGMPGIARTELGVGIRSIPYGNYVIFFRTLEDVIEIIAILEGHRDFPSVFTS